MIVKHSQRVLCNRIMSGMLSFLLVVGTVLNPVTMLPAFATASFVNLNYENHDKNAVELYVQAEEVNYKPGDEMELTLYVQNNSEEALSGVGLSWNGDEDAFEEAEFIGYEELEAELNEKGNVVNLNLEAGEIVSLGFVGTLADDLEDLNRREISFFYGAETESGANVTDRTEFEFTVGLFNELSMEFTDGNELALGETGTIDVKLSLNDLGYYYEAEVEEEEIVEVASDSNTIVATDSNTEVVTASDSDAEVATDSNSEEEDAEVATDSNTEDDVEVASDSDSEEEEDDDEYVFEITDIELNMDTYGAKFKNAKVKHATVADGKAEVEATIEFEMDDDAELGEYFGTLQAAITSDKKVYNAEIGFWYEVVDETITTGFKKHGLFTAELDNFTVNVQVPKGAFDEKVELSVTELAEDSEEFKTAEAAMENHDKEYDGMMALDICFINEAGEEVEPKEGSNVQVSIEMKAEVLPEDAIDTSLMVHHLAENTTDNEEKEIVVEDVADVQTLTEGTIEVKDEVFEAKFEVDNFSTYAVTWSTRNNLTTVDNVLDTKGIIRIDIADFNKTDISSFSTGGYSNRSSGWMNDWTDTGADRGVVQGIVKSDLKSDSNKDDYPDLNNSTSTSLKGYFDGSYGTLYADCNKLFQMDEKGYYYYNSEKNFAHLDKETKNFNLYEVPHYDTKSSAYKPAEHPQFLPLNDIKGPISNGSPSVYPFAGNNENANYLFGMVVEFDFIMPKDGKIDGEDMVFSFSGDDDVWVFIDNKLVLDMGGVHISDTGSINFAKGIAAVDLVHANSYNKKRENSPFKYNETSKQWESSIGVFSDYSKHNLKFFYMERGEGGSNCELRFNLQVLPQKSLTVTKELDLVKVNNNNTMTDIEKTDAVKYIENSVDYTFRIVEAEKNTDGTYTATDNLFVGKEEPYNLIENGKIVSGNYKTNKNDGTFTLKAGQSAQFANMLQHATDQNGNVGNTYYIVEELLNGKVIGQYGGVEFNISEGGGDTITVDDDGNSIGEDAFMSFATNGMTATESQNVIFRNKVDVAKLSTLSITKTERAGSTFTGEESFKIFVKLGGELVKQGTPYQLNETPTTVNSTDGSIQLKIGDTAVFMESIIAGTTYEVYEQSSDDWTTKYEVEAESIDKKSDGSDKVGNNVANKNNVTGDFTPGDSVKVTVENASYNFSADLNLSKTTKGFKNGKNTFDFWIEPCEANGGSLAKVANGTVIPLNGHVGTSIVVDGDKNNVTGNITIGFKNAAVDGLYYYKVYESKPSGSDPKLHYDSSVYIVGIKVETKDGVKSAAISSIKKVVDGNATTLSTGTVLSFENVYVDTTNITVKKIVAGNMGDVNKAFNFEVKIVKDGNVYEEITSQTGYTVNNNVISFSLAHNGNISLNDIPLDSVLWIRETNADSYDITISPSATVETETTENGTINWYVVPVVENLSIEVTNTKDAIIDTGISMDTLPYILIMLAVIGGIAFTVIRKRKDDELD